MEGFTGGGEGHEVPLKGLQRRAGDGVVFPGGAEKGGRGGLDDRQVRGLGLGESIRETELGEGALGGVAARAFKTFAGLCALCLVLFVLQAFTVGSGAVLLSLPFGLRLTDAGLRFSSLICLRLIGATLPLSVVLTLTPVSAVTDSLTDDFRVPFRYAFALTTAIRFIPLLSAEMSDVIEAQTARGLELDGNVFRKLRLLPPLCVPILVSAVKRVERGAISAELRGFYLRPKSGGRGRGYLRAPDFAALALCGALIALSVII